MISPRQSKSFCTRQYKCIISPFSADAPHSDGAEQAAIFVVMPGDIFGNQITDVHGAGHLDLILGNDLGFHRHINDAFLGAGGGDHHFIHGLNVIRILAEGGCTGNQQNRPY